MKSLVFDIKRYAINDGPGIRITIFFKGCPLSCTWCHNPESIKRTEQRLFSPNKCIACMKCVDACASNAIINFNGKPQLINSKCNVAGACADVCPTKAIEISGKAHSPKELLKEIENETIFFDQSDGGVTFSGGEPLLHSDFLIETLKLCKQLDIHTAVDTSCFAKPEILLAVAEYTDLFLVDLKSMNSEVHKRFTGVDNKLILSNIEFLANKGYNFIIRIPIIKGVNSDMENINATVEFLQKLPWKQREVNLLPYHNIAQNKHLKLGTQYNDQGLETPTDEEITSIAKVFENAGIKVKIGG